QVALRQLVGAEGSLAAQVEDEVVAAAACGIETREVDRPDFAAGGHALAMRPAPLEVDLKRFADRALRTGGLAGAAAHAGLEVDRVALFPARLEGAEPALDLDLVAGCNRELPTRRQGGPGAAGDQHRHRKRAVQP